MRTVLALLLVAGLTTTVQAAGTIEYIQFHSDALGEMRTVSVYLPEGYAQETRSYPVVYALHGAGCTVVDVHWLTWTYQNLRGYLDSAIGSGTIQPVIVVHPDGCPDVYRGSYYTNSDLYGRFEDYVAEDLVAYVDVNYRTIADRDYRALLGHSMGGYGAAKLALSHPEVFAATGSLAGTLQLRLDLEYNLDYVCPENEPWPYEYDPDAGGATGAMFAKAGAFSPNLDNPPYYVDFPYDENCEIIESVATRWTPNDPCWMARETYLDQSDEYPLCVWVGCGTEDPRVVETVAFAESLTVLGLPYELQLYPGDHGACPWFRVVPYLLSPEFPCGLVSVDPGPNVNVALSVLPNPNRGNATVEFALPDADVVSVVVYDVGGRVVRSVFDGLLPVGPQSLTWDGTNDIGGPVADGVYFIALRTSAGTEVTRTVRLN